MISSMPIQTISKQLMSYHVMVEDYMNLNEFIIDCAYFEPVFSAYIGMIKLTGKPSHHWK